MRARAIFTVTAVVVALMGCGGDEREDYRRGTQRAADEFKQAAQAAATQLKETDGLQEKLPGLRAFRASVDELASDFEELDPPEDLEPLNDQAVRHMRALSTNLGRYEQAAEEGDEQGAQALGPQLQTDQSELQSALDRLDRELSAR